jgi:hypothetical protein
MWSHLVETPWKCLRKERMEFWRVEILSVFSRVHLTSSSEVSIIPEDTSKTL